MSKSYHHEYPQHHDEPMQSPGDEEFDLEGGGEHGKGHHPRGDGAQPPPEEVDRAQGRDLRPGRVRPPAGLLVRQHREGERQQRDDDGADLHHGHSAVAGRVLAAGGHDVDLEDELRTVLDEAVEQRDVGRVALVVLAAQVERRQPLVSPADGGVLAAEAAVALLLPGL